MFDIHTSSRFLIILITTQTCEIFRSPPVTAWLCKCVTATVPQTASYSSHVNVFFPLSRTQICTTVAFLRITAVRQPAELQAASSFLSCFHYVCFGSSEGNSFFSLLYCTLDVCKSAVGNIVCVYLYKYRYTNIQSSLIDQKRQLCHVYTCMNLILEPYTVNVASNFRIKSCSIQYHKGGEKTIVFY